jgi:Flp pilus assembly protein TadB
MFEQMHPDVFWMLVGWLVCWGAAAACGAYLLNQRMKRRARIRRAEERQRRLRAHAPTAIYGPAQWRELWRQIDDETHILRRVDPTELPKRPKTHTGRRWLR